MGVIYKSRRKYAGHDASGENIKVIFKGEERQLNSVLSELAIEYVDELPSDVIEKIYGIEHEVSVTKEYNAYADDIIGSYFHLEGSRYEVNEDVTITHNGKVITYFVIGPTSYTADNGDSFTFLDKYDFKAEYSEVHIDYYIGDVSTNKYTQLADMEETRREFISKLEKGTAGGVASLDANGQLPVSQMPTNSQIYAGEWDASTGENPPTPSRSGIYYNISVEGTIDGEHYNVNDWIIYDGTKWNKQVQTADVSSVDGRKGAVDLTDKYAQLATENTFAEVNTFEKGLVSNQSINLKNNNINNASYVYTNNVQVPNDETTLYLGDENGANVTIGSYDDEYNTTTQIRGNTIRVYSDNPIEGITNIQERQFNDVNILSTIDNLANNANKNITYFCRFRGTCSNTPYGSGDCDFHATVHKIGGDNNWIFVELQDVRSEWGFNWVIAKVNGTWKNWMRNANTGDIPTNLSQLNNNIQAVTGTWDGSVLRLYTH